MLHATGLTEADMNKAQVGIASVWFEGNPCNMHLLDLAARVKEGVTAAGLVGMRFNTIGVSDGISMGTEGMSFSLQSRDLIADSIETVMGGQWYDANISIPGCDKNMPGCMIAIGRTNRPALIVYGGTIKPGCGEEKKKLDIVNAFQSYGEFITGHMSEKERQDTVRHACPGAGACGGMYTANTMASAIEVMGMSLPCSSSIPAEDPKKLAECFAAGKAVKTLLELDLKPRDIMTPAAFENAMVVVMVLGGSTNAVLHLIAVARSMDVALTIDDSEREQSRTAAGGFEAEREIHDERAARGGRHSRGDQDASRSGASGRHLHDGDGEDAGGECEGVARAKRRAANYSSALGADQTDGAYSDIKGQPGAGGRGGEDHREGRIVLYGSGESVRLGRGHAARAGAERD